MAVCFAGRMHLRLIGACAALLLLLAPRAEAAAVAAPPVATGVVDVATRLGYQGATAAATGMVISRNEVLTNNHVVRGATAIRVVDPTRDRSYPATVLGYSVSGDVALLRVSGTPALAPIRLGDSSTVRVGARVTAVGNAGGAGGDPSVTTGTVTALRRSIVAADEQGVPQPLSGLIETNAPIEPGDSGGPLLDRSGRAVAMITAGSAHFRIRIGGSRGFAIPLARALAIVKQIRAGRGSAAVHVGPTAFLGVGITDAPRPGALVTTVVPGGPAHRAGIAPGAVITSFAGHAVTTPQSLRPLVLALKPGAAVDVTWVDGTGTPSTARVTTVAGPPQ